MRHNAFDGGQTKGFVLDRCHHQVKSGDTFYATFRGSEELLPFRVLEDAGGGLFRVRRPNGETGLMRPSTILNVAKRYEPQGCAPSPG